MTVEEIVAAVQKKFPCFGGRDKQVRDNPIAAALKDRPPVFALGVDKPLPEAKMSITYPPEMLPRSSPDDEVEVIVCDGAPAGRVVYRNFKSQPGSGEQAGKLHADNSAASVSDDA